MFNGVQYVRLIAINLVYPLLVFRVAEIPAPNVGGLLAVGMLVLGVATFLQALRLGPFGSGHMWPATFTATYLGPFEGLVCRAAARAAGEASER